MEHAYASLAELVRINDTLSWSKDNKDSFLSAVAIIKEIVGAARAPVYILNGSCTQLVLVTDDEQRAVLGDEYRTMPVGAPRAGAMDQSWRVAGIRRRPPR